MRTALEVTQARSIAAPPDAVWAVISRPAMHERLDRRLSLVSASGEDGQVSSEYVLRYRSGLLTVRMRYVVIESDPPARLVAEVSRGEKKLAEQRGEVEPAGDGSLLRWTVVQWVGPLTRRFAEASCEKQLKLWLDAVERESLLV